MAALFKYPIGLGQAAHIVDDDPTVGRFDLVLPYSGKNPQPIILSMKLLAYLTNGLQ